MAGILQNKPRNVVPRWRLFAITSGLGELAGASTLRSAPVLEASLTELERAFNDEPNLWNGADLLSAAFVSQNRSVAEGVAARILQLDGDIAPALRTVAQCAADTVTAPERYLPPTWNQLITRLRSNLRGSPRDPVRWSDLSLAHAITGNREASLRCMQTAVGLASSNRFVLRAATRCFLHWGEPDRAHDVLRKSGTLQADPWLLSAELALASTRNMRPAHISSARRIIDDRNYTYHSTSELATALGQIELDSGSSRNARKFINHSLIEPTENALAQVQWMSRERHFRISGIEDIDLPLMYEAKATEKYEEGDWASSLEQAHLWLQDQPFSSRAATHAAHSASIMGQYNAASDYLLRVLDSNDDDAVLRNNLAYYLLRDGQDPAVARSVLEKIDTGSMPLADRLVVQATTGLLLMREGDVEAGRALYDATIRQSGRKEHVRIRVIAGLNLAIEEWRLGNSGDALQRFSDAQHAARFMKDDKEIDAAVASTRAFMGLDS